ncbi:hypothetical protein [Geobacillus sp. JS12]|nr:hypothetical protein [Geobacillus sp. JS12]
MVEYYISNIAQKMGVKTRVGIVSKAYRLKILK